MTGGERGISEKKASLATLAAGLCCIGDDSEPRSPRGDSAPDQAAGGFAARTPTISIFGASSNRRGGSAIKALAMSPARCAWRPEGVSA